MLAGLLCALGVLGGATAVRAAAAPHPHPHAKAAAMAVLADGHGTNVRTVDDGVTTTAVPTAEQARGAAASPTTSRSDDVASVQTVRTRGPPARV